MTIDKRSRRVLFAAILAAGVAGLYSGCEVDSGSNVERNVGVNYSGFYTADGGAGKTRIVQRNSGKAINSMNLRQTGDDLEGIDNNGIIFRGRIGDVSDNTSGNLIASFNMEGVTTDGQEAIFSGTLSTGGGSNSTSSTSGTMQGTYIEPGFYSTFFAQASIPGASSGNTPTNAPTNGTNNSITISMDDAETTARDMASASQRLWFMRRLIEG